MSKKRKLKVVIRQHHLIDLICAAHAFAYPLSDAVVTRGQALRAIKAVDRILIQARRDLDTKRKP